MHAYIHAYTHNQPLHRESGRYREVIKRKPHEFKIAALGGLVDVFVESGRNVARVHHPNNK